MLSRNEIERQIAEAVAESVAREEKWFRFEKQTAWRERVFANEVISLFQRQARAVQRQMQWVTWPRRLTYYPQTKSAESNEYADRIFKPEEWAADFKAAELPYAEASLLAGATDSITELGLAITFDVYDPRIVELLQGKAQKFAKDVNATTAANIKKTLAVGVERGEGMIPLRNRVMEVFTQAERSRAYNIARTEILGTYNKGTLEGYIQTGVVPEKSWLTSRDARVRDSHRAMEGQTVPIREKFSNGLMHPGDWNGSAAEICQCRCTILAEGIE